MLLTAVMSSAALNAQALLNSIVLMLGVNRPLLPDFCKLKNCVQLYLAAVCMGPNMCLTGIKTCE